MTTGGKMISLKELPVGHRFNPSDEVLVNYHLKRKHSNIKEEYCLIPEFDIYKLPPWDLITKFNDLSDLASDGRECFFYHRWNDPSSKRHNRRTKEGFWKDTGGDQKLRVTDQTKWLKKILVYRLGKQKSAVETEWAMHEYQDISNPAIVVCRIHKSKPKKVKERVDSGSSQACSDGSPVATASPKSQTEPPKISPNMSVDVTVESQTLASTSNINIREERSSPSEDTYIEGGDMSVFHQTPTDQSSNNVLPGSLYPPRHPRTMHTEEISPIVGNTSFNDCRSELVIHGRGAQLPFVSPKHRAQEINFKEAPQSTSNSQIPIPSPNSCLLSPEEQMLLQELLSVSGTHPPSDSSGGGIPNAFHFGQSYKSRQTNLELTQDGSYQVDGSWTYPRGATLKGGGDMSVFHQTPTDQSSNNVLPGSLYPPQHPRTMPTGEISPSVVNTSFNDCGSELVIHGRGAQLPFVSPKHRAQEINFKEAPQSTSNSQIPIPSPNSCLLSPEEQMLLQELLSVSGTHPSSESSGGGIPSSLHFCQSSGPRHTNLEVTRDGSYQVDGSRTYPRGVTLKGGGDMSVFHQTPTDQSLNNVLPGSLYPPQHPRTMPTEEISPIVGNTSFNDCGSELVIHGRGAQLPFVSPKHRAQEINFEEAPQSTSNSQIPIPPPNSCLLSPKEQMLLQELLSISGTHPSSDISGGGTPNVFHCGQSYESHQTNFEMTRDGSYQVDGSHTYPWGVTLEEGGNMSVYRQTPTDQSSNCVLLGSLYPPQHPWTMPTEEMSPIADNKSFSDSGSELDIHGWGAQLPFVSREYGAQETNFKVTQDFATASSAVIQYSDTGSLLGSFLASHPLPEAEMEESSPRLSSIVPGGYGREYCGLPCASGVALEKSNHRISATY